GLAFIDLPFETSEKEGQAQDHCRRNQDGHKREQEFCRMVAAHEDETLALTPVLVAGFSSQFFQSLVGDVSVVAQFYIEAFFRYRAADQFFVPVEGTHEEAAAAERVAYDRPGPGLFLTFPELAGLDLVDKINVVGARGGSDFGELGLLVEIIVVFGILAD